MPVSPAPDFPRDLGREGVARRFAATLALSLALSGCATYEDAAIEQQLTFRVKQYEQTARWGKVRDLYGFLPPEQAQKAEPPESIDGIRVTRYDRTPVLHQDPTHAVVEATVEYVHQDRQIVRTLVDTQTWEYDPLLEKWYRSNPIPPFE
jgi:hypothetical protein